MEKIKFEEIKIVIVEINDTDIIKTSTYDLNGMLNDPTAYPWFNN